MTEILFVTSLIGLHSETVQLHNEKLSIYPENGLTVMGIVKYKLLHCTKLINKVKHA